MPMRKKRLPHFIAFPSFALKLDTGSYECIMFLQACQVIAAASVWRIQTKNPAVCGRVYFYLFGNLLQLDNVADFSGTIVLEEVAQAIVHVARTFLQKRQLNPLYHIVYGYAFRLLLCLFPLDCDGTRLLDDTRDKSAGRDIAERELEMFIVARRPENKHLK